VTFWIDTLERLSRENTPGVVVTVAAAKGSTPRGAGTKMIVTATEALGTIGGGHLELMATEAARRMLSGDNGAETHLRQVPLGPELGQCCGGNTTLLMELFAPGEDRVWLVALAEARDDARQCVLVSPTDGDANAKMVVTEAALHGTLGPSDLDAAAGVNARELLAGADGGARLVDIGSRTLLFEAIRPPDLNIVLFGAGHVGRALVEVLADLPCRITWIDSRENQFPERRWTNVAMEDTDAPEFDVDGAPPGSFFLVMTHSHGLDLKICERILRRGDFTYFGLIGSRTKRQRFENRLMHKGLSSETVARMTCPIGVAGISGKHPREIAIAVAAEILKVRDATNDSAAGDRDPAAQQPGGHVAAAVD
jgi:xanthine dehydrogenase accessory factor